MSVETEVTLHAPETSTYGLAVYQINDGYLSFYVNTRGVYLDYRIKSVNGHQQRMEWGEGGIPDKVRLRITSDGERYYFSYATDQDKDFRSLGALECPLVSTEMVGGFTGVTLGMFTECSDGESYGEFSYFDYTEE